MTDAEAVTSARVERLALTDFRCFTAVEFEPAASLSVIVGRNGQGKTSLLEAVGWVARRRSFRGVPDAALVRRGADRAVVRAELIAGERRVLFEAEIRAEGRNRIMVNRQVPARRRDLHGLLRVTVFSPDDLLLAKGGPAERRGYLDELLLALSPRYEAAYGDYERVLRQRNALLRAGVRNDDDRVTLEVFDEQLVAAGSELVRGRLRLVERLGPAVDASYRELAGPSGAVTATYRAEWAETGLGEAGGEAAGLLRAALGARRRAEIERGVTLVGPHRDDLQLTIGGLDARSQASQGEQRTLVLALRLAGHRTVAALTGVEPVLLLDDVFSELDDHRSGALARGLPAGQALLTTAGLLPRGLGPNPRFRLEEGRVLVQGGTDGPAADARAGSAGGAGAR